MTEGKKMDSIKDIKAEITKISEAIGRLASVEDSSAEVQAELQALANELTEKVHLLKFATQILNGQDENKETNVKPESVDSPEGQVKEPEPEEHRREEEKEEPSEPATEEKPESRKQPEEQEPAGETPQNHEEDDESLNEKISKLSQSDNLANRLEHQPIKNLKTAIGLNERFLFANELFQGDGSEFQRAIEEFNHLESMDAAERLIEHKYQQQYDWDPQSRTVQHFKQYLERRYSYRNTA